MKRAWLKYPVYIFIICLSMLAVSCFESTSYEPLADRLSAIPADLVKYGPADDIYPPVLHSDLWEDPVPMPGPINTPGGEDSAFITPDGNDFYFFFTPDVSKDVYVQLEDGVTGIYWSKREGNSWSYPERVLLQDRDKLSLDGCLFVSGDTMWFCSAREGNTRGVDFYIAHLENGQWTDWENAGTLLNDDYGIGELHITSGGDQLYFHADKEGGVGGLDIWMCEKSDGTWQPPVNVTAVNTSGDEGWPFITEDGSELWITRTYMRTPGLFRSVKSASGEWGEPELIISDFAGESTMDRDGNIYFTHHFYKDAVMLEADIYVAYKK